MISPRFVFICLFMTMTSEVLLSPFYPQYFTSAFHVDGVAMTSFFIICCRIVVIVMTPLWGMLLKKWKVKHIIVASLLMTALVKVILSEVSTFYGFLATSLVLLVFQSSLYLLYPYLVGGMKNGQKKASAATTYVFIVHTAIIVASLFGSAIIAWEMPLKVYQYFALADMVLAVWLITRKASSLKKEKTPAYIQSINEPIFFYLLAIFFFHLGHNVIRPYFTLFTSDTYGMSSQGSALLYVMPSIMAIVLKLTVPTKLFNGKVIPLFYSVTGASSLLLCLQAYADHLSMFIISRILYGAGFYLSMVILDIYLFQKSKEGAAYYYSWLIAVQNIALLIAPLLALEISRVNLALPLAAGAAALLAASAVMPLRNKTIPILRQVKENEG
ncbi:MFS transporter [Priestia megaterium]|uniref:MFS transporter n=1 Tax=Priestia megaterium TaxID=1404 RepID=UPI000471DDBE|nr:MFS transporter [Priestia megaterium]PFA97201.1 MFS transporter [Priestia megaterium]PFR97090.1 MFS transporter [Priestia megaterium]TCN16027.1 putative MFS family arabinose efflux permease [Bacillus sp. BK006]